MSKVYKDLRKAYLTHDNIAVEAYFIWERAGKPNGDDEIGGRKIREIHWFSAIERLELAADHDAEQLFYCSDLGRQILADGTGVQKSSAGL